MDYKLKRPCANCPFRREGGIPLRPGRIREIAGMMLDSQGGSFPCHRTVDQDDREESSEQHCAGALAFAHKQYVMPQLARIMMRLGAFNPDKLESLDEVWNDINEWLDCETAVSP